MLHCFAVAFAMADCERQVTAATERWRRGTRSLPEATGKSDQDLYLDWVVRAAGSETPESGASGLARQVKLKAGRSGGSNVGNSGGTWDFGRKVVVSSERGARSNSDLPDPGRRQAM